MKAVIIVRSDFCQRSFMKSADQFALPGPLAITGDEYAKEINEVRELGSVRRALAFGLPISCGDHAEIDAPHSRPPYSKPWTGGVLEALLGGGGGACAAGGGPA
jgi:hypothetical protein